MSLVAPNLVGREFESAQRHSESNYERTNSPMSLVTPNLVANEFESCTTPFRIELWENGTLQWA